MTTDKERRNNYIAAFDTPTGQAILLDLNAFAMNAEPGSRLGRLEVLAYIYESMLGKPNEEEA